MVKLPDGLTLTEDGHLSGTIPIEGTHEVELLLIAPDGTEKPVTFTIEVGGDGKITGKSSSGGCDTGLGLWALGLALLAIKKRRG